MPSIQTRLTPRQLLHSTRFLWPALALALAAPGCSCGDSPADPDASVIDGAVADGPGPVSDGAPPDAQPAIMTCPETVPAATSGVCDVTPGTGAGVLLRGTVLGAGTVFENGQVLVDGTQIVCVGCDCSSHAQYATADRVDCAGAVISPALINAHDHLTFTERAPLAHGTLRFEHRHEWRDEYSTPGNQHGTGQDSAGMRWGEMRMVLGGAVSLVGSGRARNMMRNLDDLLDTEEAMGFEPVEYSVFSLGDNDSTFRPDCGWDYEYTEIRAAESSAFEPHIGEGINTYAAEEFRCQSTSFDNGRDYTEKNAVHIHCIGLTAADYYRMVRDSTKLMWSPRSNIDLYGMTANVTLFHRLGGMLALGTDWTYSGSANLLRELACADQFNHSYLDQYFTDEDLWKMVTLNAAVATNTDALIGSLEAGKLADISVFAAEPGQHHRAVIEADNRAVVLVMRAGDLLYGEKDTLTALGQSCDDIPVCEETRSICATREFGTSYASIATAVAAEPAAYPAVFCDPTPPDEPTCTPSRPGEFSGELTAGDSDGDGIANGSDNCPLVFNPIRPIDDGAQPDADGDGEGDPCDLTPLPPDLDGDAVANAGDNCPFDSNGGQTDLDEDLKGDECDFCPSVPNPDSVCRPYTTIAAIQNGTLGEGAEVYVPNVVVTGVYGYGAYVQDPATGPEYAGVEVYTNGDPGVAVGDLVNVQGSVTEFFGNTEIEWASITRLGATTPIAPTPLSVADAALEQYEGVLVELTNATVSSTDWDCSVDNASCTDQDLWEVSAGGSEILVYDRLYEGADWSAHVGDLPVSGVMMYRHNRRRIMPRTAADFE